MTATGRLRLADDVIAVRVADETVTWHRVTGRLTLLDPVATQVLTRLDGRAIDAVIADLCTASGAPVDVVQPDVYALVAELHEFGVLQGDA